MGNTNEQSIRDRIVNYYNSEEFRNVDSYNANQDFFRIIHSERRELAHSDMIAWMLDVNGSHGLREFGIRKFLQIIALSAKFAINKKTENQLDVKLQKLFLFGNYELGRVDIKREVYAKMESQNGKYIDILVDIEIKERSSNESLKKLDIVLENKVDSLEHDEQTLIYYEYEMKERYGKGKEKYINGAPIFVYLLPVSTIDLANDSLDKNKKCGCESYIYLNYQYLVTYLIEPMLEKSLEKQYEYLLHSYLKTLSCSFDDNEKTATIMATTLEERSLLIKYWDNHEELLIAAIEEDTLVDSKKGDNAYKEVKDVSTAVHEAAEEIKASHSRYKVFGEGNNLLTEQPVGVSDAVATVIKDFCQKHQNSKWEDLAKAFNDIKGRRGDVLKLREVEWNGRDDGNVIRYKSVNLQYDGKALFVNRNWDKNNIDSFQEAVKKQGYRIVRCNNPETNSNADEIIPARFVSQEERSFVTEFFYQNETLINRALNAKIDDPQLEPEAKDRYYKLNKKLEELAGKKHASFRFSFVNIKKGETIVFEPTGVEVKVLSDNKIEYEGREYTLTRFCKEYMPGERRNNSDSYQGPAFFTYKGRTLTELRQELEIHYL